MTIAAQAVQRSAFPNAYARWETLAVRVVATVTGASVSQVTCGADDAPSEPHSAHSVRAEAMGPDGLAGRARVALEAIRGRFGVTDVGGFCPGGCTSGHGARSDHYTGRAVDFMLLPMNQANRELGERIAEWLVANFDVYGVKYVIWYEHIWSAARADEGWRPYRDPSGGRNDTLAHRDHVHLSVY